MTKGVCEWLDVWWQLCWEVTLKHANLLFCFLFCVRGLYTYVHNEERYSSDLSENGLLKTQAVLSLHYTIQLNLNKMVTLLLCCHCVGIFYRFKLKNKDMNIRKWQFDLKFHSWQSWQQNSYHKVTWTSTLPHTQEKHFVKTKKCLY